MKSIISICITVAFSLTTFVAQARDDVGNYNIQAVLSTEMAKAKLGDQVKFYFGDSKHPKVSKRFGVFGTNKKTNAFNKSDQEACEWTFLSAMLQLRDRALQMGGNAVINIKSNYKNHLTSSTDTFQCGAGAIIAGVPLQGEVVKIGK